MATTYYMSGISLIVQYLTNLGLLAAGGQVNTYVGGSVSTPVTTYTDSTGIVANANPMTLSSSGRPSAASGAPVAFWVPGGTTVKLVVTDAGGNLLVSLDNVPALNDLTNSANALQTLLAIPASSNSTGAGPVAGADLVANAVKSYDVFSDVRAANAPVLATGQTLDIEVQGAVAVGDSLGGFFYWAPSSVAADDGRTVLRPNSVALGSAGRWLRLYPQGVPQVITQTVDQQVVSSTVLVNNTALTLALSIGTWLLQLRGLFLGVGGTGQGWKAQMSFGGTTAGPTALGGVTSANAVAAATAGIAGAAVTAAAVSSTSGDVCNLDLILQVTVAGTLNIQFAQNSSSANATVMKAGSTLIATRVA